MIEVNEFTVDRALNDARPVDYDDRLNGWAAFWHGEVTEIETELGVFERVADKKFGPEDTYEASPVFVVVKIDGRYFQKEGLHSSWDGAEFRGDCVEVEPVEVPLTFYRHKE